MPHGPASPRPAPDLYTRLKRDRSVPVQDVGIIDAIQRGAVTPVPGIASFTSTEVVLNDGRRLSPDVVIAATGYRTGLAALLGPLPERDQILTPRGIPAAPLIRRGNPSAPGLYFVGYTVSISGALRDIGIEAKRIARSESRQNGALNRPGRWRPADSRLVSGSVR